MKKIKNMVIIIFVACLVLIAISVISKNSKEKRLVIPSENSGNLLEEDDVLIKEKLQTIASGGEENSVYFAD